MGSRRTKLFALAVIGSIAIWAATFMIRLFSPVDPFSTHKLLVEVRRGESPREIARYLEAEGIIKSARDFLWVGRITGKWNEFKAGEYEVSPSMTPFQVLGKFASGVSAARPITLREGINMYEIGDIIEAKGLATKAEFVRLCQDPMFMRELGLTDPLPPSLEGYLYPETYFLNRTMTPKDMISTMVKKLLAHWGDAEKLRAAELGLSFHQVLTLASIIEKETGVPEERPLISSVFHNRLKKRMRIQSDPTTIYGIWARYKGNIHKSDLLEKTPYNTYTIPALPIGPISNPGKEAIQAALYPSTSEFLFFVSKNAGTHVFSKTVQEHNAAVREYQMNAKAREGKSWRDRLKSSEATQ